MKIAIKFGDNDFCNTFHGVLQTLLEAYRWNTLPNNKEQLCKMINKISYGCYLLFQNQFEYNEEQSGEYDLHTESYLKITSQKLFLNEEIPAMLEESFHNGEIFILDTDLDYPNSSPVYSV